MRTLVYAIIALVVVGVAAVLIGPSFVNWTAYKGDIARRLSETTGREVVIRGEVGVDMLPRPTVSVADVRVANAGGGAAATLASVAAVRVDVRFAPLLRGDIRLARVTLVEPRLNLERVEDGGWNWRAAARKLDDAASTAGALPLGADARIETVRIDNGTLVYRDHRHGKRVTLRRVHGRVSADGGRGPFDAEGTFAWRGRTVRATARAGRLGGTSTPFAVTLRPQHDTGRAEVRLAGTLASARPLDAQAELEVSGSHGETLLRALGLPASVASAVATQAYSVSATLALDGRMLTAENLDLQLGDLGVTGNVSLEAGPPVVVDGDLTVQRLTLDRFIDAGDPAEAWASETTGGASGNAAWRLPRRVRGALTITAGALVYRDQVIRQSRMALRLADGRLELAEASALLPGGSEVHLSGAVTTPDGGPRFDGRIEAASNNLRGVFDWLGVDVTGVPPDRLRRLDLTARLRARPGRVTVRGMDLAVDTLTARGGVVVVPGARPGLGIGGRLDRLDLDAYWRGGAPASDGRTGGDEAAGRRAILDRFDANFDVSVGTLIAGGRKLRDARFRGALRQGTLDLDTVEAEAVAGGPLRLDGTIRNVATPAPTLDVNLTWQNLRPRAALQWLNVADGGVPAGWPTVNVSGQLAGTPGELRVNLALQALDGLLTANGTMARAAGGARPTADLRVALQHDSLRRLLDAFTTLPRLTADPGAVDLAARVRSTDTGIEARDLNGALGPVQLTGGIDADLDGARPHVAVNLDAGALPLAAFAPAADGSRNGGGAGDWSAAPLGLAALRRVDGNLTLRADAIRLDGLAPVERARIEATLADGVLTLSTAAGTWGGGSARIAGTLDATAVPTVEASLDLADVDAAAVQPAIDGLRVDGPVSFQGALSARGRSERALIETLTGEGEIEGTLQLRPKRADGRLFTAVFGGALNDVAGIAGAAERVDAAFRDRDIPVAGTWRVGAGTVRTTDIALEGSGLTARISGQANLPDWRSDVRLRVRRPNAANDTPFLDANLQGPLDAPNVQLAGSGLNIEQPSGPSAPSDPAAPNAPGAPGETDDGAARDSRSGSGDGAAPDADAATAGSAKAGTGADTANTSAEGDGKAMPSAEDVIRDLLKELPKEAE